MIDGSIEPSTPVLVEEQWIPLKQFVSSREGIPVQDEKQHDLPSGKPSTGLPPVSLPPPSIAPVKPISTYPTASLEPAGGFTPVQPEQKSVKVDAPLKEYIDEEGPTDLYYKARTLFYLSYGFSIPLVGIAIAVFCWLRAKKWVPMVNEHVPNMTTRMVMTAKRSSTAWFAFACALTFICLTSYEFPLSLLMLSGFQLGFGICVILITFLIYVLCKFLLEEEMDLYNSAVVGIRTIAGCMTFWLVDYEIFGILLYVGWTRFLIPLAITALAIYSVLDIFNSRPSFFRIGAIAFVLWFLLRVIIYALYSTLQYLT